MRFVVRIALMLLADLCALLFLTALPTPATLESGLSNGDKKKRPSTGNVIYISDSDDDAARKVKPEPVKKKVKREKEGEKKERIVIHIDD